jgi:hypothetical protein
MAATDARPVPRKNAAYRFYFAARKSDGTLITGWTGADSEVSIDGGAFADCAAEATEIGASGCGYIDLSAAEMNGDAVLYKLTLTNTGHLTMVITFFPEETGDYRVNVEQFGGVAGTFAAGRPEARAASLADGSIAAATFAAGAIDANALATDAIGSLELAAGAVTELAAGVATALAAGVTLADGAITAAKFAAGAIDANAIATDAFGSAEVAGSAASEVATAVAAAISASGVTVSDKTGFSLAAGGLAGVGLDDTDLPMTNLVRAVTWLVRRHGGASDKTFDVGTGTGVIAVSDLSGNPWTEQPIADDGVGNQTLGEAAAP